jgi:hypothetical protein
MARCTAIPRASGPASSTEPDPESLTAARPELGSPLPGVTERGRLGGDRGASGSTPGEWANPAATRSATSAGDVCGSASQGCSCPILGAIGPRLRLESQGGLRREVPDGCSRPVMMNGLASLRVRDSAIQGRLIAHRAADGGRRRASRARVRCPRVTISCSLTLNTPLHCAERVECGEALQRRVLIVAECAAVPAEEGGPQVGMAVP